VPEPQALEARFLASITEISAHQWNSLIGSDYPFLRHEFLALLESTGCTDRTSGWLPLHATLYRGDNLIALMPLYLKSHSYGEYVFDWSWADAWRRHGLNYYPKLVTAVPFTPATGPRLCLASGEERAVVYPILLQAIRQMAQEQGASSWHVLFPEPDASEALERAGTSIRVASQFHWINRGYTCFDDFLAEFNSRKRKSLKRERRRVEEQGIEMRVIEGEQITAADWERFYFFYQMTYTKRSGHGGYLNREFFLGLGAAIGKQCVLVMAYQEQQAVAGALYFRSADTLYGRYWGCEQELDCLHFETCYYQGIEYAIKHSLQRFDPGAQGEHKIQRGFTPIKTWSNHWIADPGFADAIADFSRREQQQIDNYISSASTYLPFKQDTNSA
jgi:predicted N-acyltransferase